MTHPKTTQQKYDDKGRLLRESELIKKELNDFLPSYFDKQDLDNIVAYVMQQKNDEYYRAMRLGISIGRRDLYQAIISSNNLEELQKWAAKELNQQV